MKRSILLTAAASLALLTACGGGDEEPDEEPTDAEEPSAAQVPFAEDSDGDEESPEASPDDAETSPSDEPSPSDLDDIGFPVDEIEDYLASARADGQSAEEIAELAAQAMVIWDTREDTFQGQSENRARPLMDEEVYGDDLTQPENPVYPEGWLDVYDEGAASVPVVRSFDESEQANGFWEFTVEMCWVWVTESGEQVPAGPLYFDIRTEEQGDENVIYNYEKINPTWIEDDNNPCDTASA